MELWGDIMPDRLFWSGRKKEISVDDGVDKIRAKHKDYLGKLVIKNVPGHTDLFEYAIEKDKHNA